MDCVFLLYSPPCHHCVVYFINPSCHPSFFLYPSSFLFSTHLYHESLVHPYPFICCSSFLIPLCVIVAFIFASFPPFVLLKKSLYDKNQDLGNSSVLSYYSFSPFFILTRSESEAIESFSFNILSRNPLFKHIPSLINSQNITNSYPQVKY